MAATAWRRWTGRALALIALVVLAACQPPASAEVEAPGDTLRVEGVWVRAVPAGGTSALYLRVVNPTAQEDRLLTVETGFARAVEIHQTTNANGVMRMRPLPEGVAVPAGQTLEIQPGGIHVMLLEVSPALEVGQKVPVVLVFAKAGKLALTVPVQNGPSP